MLDLNEVMRRLAKARPIFHSEADFQHALAWQLHAEYPEARIRLEYRPFANEKVYLDVWFELHGQATAIELKYPTKRTAIISTENETFTLADHGAHDITRYDFVKDIVRIERIVDAIPKTSAAAIMVTNDPLYWNASPKALTAIDTDFRIHEGRTLAGLCAWGSSAGAGTTKGRTAVLNLRGAYLMTWQAYSNVSDQWGKFRFVIVEPVRATPCIP